MQAVERAVAEVRRRGGYERLIISDSDPCMPYPQNLLSYSPLTEIIRDGLQHCFRRVVRVLLTIDGHA